MSTIIKDGQGTGNTAHVTKKGQVATASVVVSELTHISSVEEGTDNYHFSRVLTSAATAENIAHLTYNGDYQLQIDTVRLSREDVNLTSGSQAVFTIYRDIEYTSGGSVVTAFNMNLSSSQAPDTTGYAGSTAMVLDDTNKRKLEDIVVESESELNYKGSLILKKGDSITIKAYSKNIGDKMHVSLFSFEIKEAI